MTKGLHNQIIAAAAREILAPQGFRRKGHSRTWFADHSWFLVVVEFQPSSGSKGSYLNVGANFLWWPKDHLSFDFGDRVESFSTFEDETQFAEVASHLARRAREEHDAIQRALSSFQRAARALRSHRSGWGLFHRAVSLGLAGDVRRSVHSFAQLAQPGHDERPWVLELRATAEAFAVLVPDRSAFHREVRHRITRARELLALPYLSEPLGDAA